MYASLPLKALLAVLEILLLDGEVVSWLIPNKSLMMSPLRCSQRTFLCYPSLKESSLHPWQHWRRQFRLGFISKTSTSLCFDTHPLGSSDGLLWKETC